LAGGVVRHRLCPHRMNVSPEIDPELVQYLTAIAHDDAICAEFPLALNVRQRLKARAELRWVQAVARREGLPPLPRLTTRCSTPLRRGRGIRVTPPPWARTMAGRGATHRARATRLYAHPSRADDDQQAGCSMLWGKRCQRSAWCNAIWRGWPTREDRWAQVCLLPPVWEPR